MTGIESAKSVRPADFLCERMSGFTGSVASILPAGYAAYARVLHPVYRLGTGTAETWRSVAARIGRAFDKRTHWEDIVAGLSGDQHLYEAPSEGTLDARSLGELTSLLRAHTATTEKCWLALWDGYLNVRAAFGNAPVFELPGRRYRLLSGELAGPAASLCDGPFFQWANLCWPDDRAWCVASDIDLNSTYVAGSGPAIRALCSSASLEVFEVLASDRITRS